MYGDGAKTTTISVKLRDDDLKLLDGLRDELNESEHLNGAIDSRMRWHRGWGRPGRGEALRAALRFTANPPLAKARPSSSTKSKTKRRPKAKAK